MRWDSNYLAALTKQAEINISRKIPCIFKQTQLDVIAGTAVYELPSDVISILRLTYKSHKVWARNSFEAQEQGFDLLPLNSRQGRPFLYLQRPTDYKHIELWPIPDETVSHSGPIDYKNDVVLSYFAFANPDGVDRLPVYLRGTLVNAEVVYKAYMKEGSTQLLKAAEQLRSRYDILESEFRYAMNRVSRAVLHSMLPNIENRRKVGR